MTEVHERIAMQLEKLVHNRFNKETLNEALSHIFQQPIRAELVGEDDINAIDWELYFEVDSSYVKGGFSVYFLPHKNRDCFGNTIYITEVGYEFFD